MNRSHFGMLLGLLRPYHRQLAGLVALTAGLAVLAMLPPLITRAIIDRVITAGDRSAFMGLAVVMLALPLVNAVCGFLQTIGITLVGQRYVFDIRDALYRHLLHLSLRFYNRHNVGMLVNRLMGDSGTVQNLLTAQTVTVVSDLICAAFAVTATLLIDWRLALVLLLIMVVFVVNYRLSITHIRQANRTYQYSMDRLSGGIQNRLVANLAVKTCGMETAEHDRFRAQSESSLALVREVHQSNVTFWMNVGLLSEVGRGLVFFLGCAMVLRDDCTYGDVVAFTTYAMQLLWPAVRFSMLAKQIQDAVVAADRIGEILAEPPEIQDRPAARAVGRLAGAVTFDHVSFHYEKGKPVIVDFNLQVPAGRTIALIGPTGCGKTTILSLLMRFYDVTGGAIRLDGLDLRDLRLRDLRRQFGIVLQEPLLFSVNIAENIRYARPDATRAQIEAAAQVAEIHEFIAGLPKGYDTEIGSEGLQLSVGQKQRLAIARAVLADPAILIMDEATSSLDSESEHAIQLAMARVLRGRTAFIVAHRLSTIRNADLIVLLRHGRIFEMGSHDDLMARPAGAYRELFNKYIGKGVLEGG